jgi:hypothetical protein
MKRETQEEFYKINDSTPLAIIEERVELKYKTLIEKLEQKLAISKENEKATTIMYATQHPHGEIKYLTPKDDLTKQLWQQRELDEKLAKINTVENENKRLKQENICRQEQFKAEKARRDEIVEAKVRLLLEELKQQHNKIIRELEDDVENKKGIISEKEAYIKDLLKKPSVKSFTTVIKEKLVTFKAFLDKLDEEKEKK